LRLSNLQLTGGGESAPLSRGETGRWGGRRRTRGPLDLARGRRGDGGDGADAGEELVGGFEGAGLPAGELGLVA